MNPDVSTDVDDAGECLLVGLEGAHGVRAAFLVLLELDAHQVHDVLARLEAEATTELAFLEQLGVGSGRDPELVTDGGYGTSGSYRSADRASLLLGVVIWPQIVHASSVGRLFQESLDPLLILLVDPNHNVCNAFRTEEGWLAGFSNRDRRVPPELSWG